MVAKVRTLSFNGIRAENVDVEVKIASGMNSFTIVGLGDKAVAESKERVRAAITSTGLSWPFERITVNLSPADIQKEGTHYDLAIALGIMIEIGVLEQRLVDHYYVLGELSLDGTINKVSGIISASLAASEKNFGIICPFENGGEATWAGKDLEIIAPKNILSLTNHLKDIQKVDRPIEAKIKNDKKYPDLFDVKGQDLAKRALEIAAAGGHNILLIGPPGTGKSMLASRLPGILPDLSLEEILESSMIKSIAGSLENGYISTERDFREVHHSCSMPAMVGGGTKVKPGEVSLAHNGILFLDELAEFPAQVLDSLRQSLETEKISISRVNSHVTYPANFQLVAAMNPCKCGYFGDKKRECKKVPICAQNYKNKISGPFLDRIDIIVNVGFVDLFDKKDSELAERSSKIKRRVLQAREIQKNRFEKLNLKENQKVNAKINGEDLQNFCYLGEDEEAILKSFLNKTQSSMRAITRILRVSRTIADLDGCQNIKSKHLFEAISYRREL